MEEGVFFIKEAICIKIKAVKFVCGCAAPQDKYLPTLILGENCFILFSENHGGHFLFSGFSRICMELRDSKIKHASLMHGKPINDMANLNREVVISS